MCSTLPPGWSDTPSHHPNPGRDATVTIYRHTHHHVSLPFLDFNFGERDTSNSWRIVTCRDLAYFVRYGRLLFTEDSYRTQRFDADLMARRIECSFLLTTGGLIRLEFLAGVFLPRIYVKGVQNFAFAVGKPDTTNAETMMGWLAAFTTHTWLRRAAEDSCLALSMESEAVLFAYRAFEWLKEGLKVDWKNLGAALGIPQRNVNQLKKTANNPDAAARHAVESGKKMWFGEAVVGGWMYGLLNAITQARMKVDPDFAERVKRDGHPWPLN